MFIDLIVGIAASLIASLIVGFWGNKAASKKNSTILKLYVLFLSIIVFVCCAIVCIVLNKDFGERIVSITDVGLIQFYDSCILAFCFIITGVVLVTLFVMYLEASAKAEKRLFKKAPDGNETHAKEDKE